MNVDVDEGLYHSLEDLATRRKRDVGQLLNEAVEGYLKQQANLPSTIAPKGYGLRPDERKVR